MSRLPIYYGWFVLAAAAVCEMLITGATAYGAGLFILPVQAEFHLSRADASSAVSILYLGAAVIAPVAGRLLDRFSIRLVMAAGAVVLALGLAAIASAASLTVMALALLVPVAFGYMALGPLTTSTLTSRWFGRRRGLALGLAAVATSGGGLLVPLLAVMIGHQGWRQALLTEGLGIAVIVLALAFLVLRNDPASAGLQGHAEVCEAPSPAKMPAASWRGFLGSGFFWIPALVLAGISGTAQATVTLVVPYGQGLGLTAPQAAALVSAFAAAAAFTKVGAGLLADRIAPLRLLAAAPLAMLASWLALFFMASQPGLLIASLLAGVALGCALPTAASLLAAHFGAARFGGVLGWAYLLTLSAAILAVRISGMVFDAAHSYRPAFLLFAGVMAVLLAATLWFAARRKA